jgi:hypothetical protein
MSATENKYPTLGSLTVGSPLFLFRDGNFVKTKLDGISLSTVHGMVDVSVHHLAQRRAVFSDNSLTTLKDDVVMATTFAELKSFVLARIEDFEASLRGETKPTAEEDEE